MYDNMYFENIIYDDYDYSFEVVGIEDYNYRCTKEEIKEIFDLGFEKFWIVFDDGSELEYYKSYPVVCLYKDSGKTLIRKEFLDGSEMCNCTINWAEGGNCFVCGKIRRINTSEGTFSSL
jgi:hypothetical protein